MDIDKVIETVKKVEKAWDSVHGLQPPVSSMSIDAHVTQLGGMFDDLYPKGPLTESEKEPKSSLFSRDPVKYMEELKAAGVRTVSRKTVMIALAWGMGRDFEETKFLGKGSYGNVTLGTYPSGIECVAKRTTGSALAAEQLQKERQILTSLSTTEPGCITHLVGIDPNDPNTIILEYERGGSLAQQVTSWRDASSRSPSTPDQFGDSTDRISTDSSIISNSDSDIQPHSPSTAKLRFAMLTLAENVKTLHKHGVIHRDLKPENVLGRDMKLCDFGTAMYTKNWAPQKLDVTSPHITAPEVIADKDITRPEAIDIYSLGIVFYYMETKGSYPFKGDNQLSIMWEALKKEPPKIDGDPQFNTLIQQMLSKDPEKRPKIDDVIIGVLKTNWWPEK